MDKIFIVGGGASLNGFDWSLLKDRYVIAVNRAFEVLPSAEVVYFSDLRFWQWNSAELVNHKGQKVSLMRKMKHKKVELYTATGVTGLDMSPGCLRHGNNSGYAAINLAAHLGAKEIVLLGFDMKFTNSQCHWHDGYPVVNLERSFDKMRKFFATLVSPLQELNIKVFNANLESSLDVFPKIKYDEALS